MIKTAIERLAERSISLHKRLNSSGPDYTLSSDYDALSKSSEMYWDAFQSLLPSYVEGSMMSLHDSMVYSFSERKINNMYHVEFYIEPYVYNNNGGLLHTDFRFKINWVSPVKSRELNKKVIYSTMFDPDSGELLFVYHPMWGMWPRYISIPLENFSAQMVE